MSTIPDKTSTGKNTGNTTYSEQLLPRSDKTVLLVIGLSGAGKSTVLHVFEDMRLFTADGVPPVLMPDMVRLLQDPALEGAEE